jgi:hypothetical protein
MRPGELVAIFVTLLPAIFYWFWRFAPNDGHEPMFLVVIPVLLLGVLICLGVDVIFLRRTDNKGGWPFAVVINALTVLAVAFEFFFR